MRHPIFFNDDHTFLFRYEEKTASLIKYKPIYKRKITIGIIIDTVLNIPPLTGVTYRLYYLSTALQKSGITVKIFLCNRNSIHSHKRGILSDDSDVEYHLIPEDVFYNPEELKNIISEHKLDILQFEDAVSVLRYKNIIEALNVPVCLELHDIEAALFEGLGFPGEDITAMKAITALACDSVDAVICMTAKDQTELINDIGIDSSRLFLVPNPIDTKLFPYHGANIKTNNLLFIGNMFYWPNAQAASVLVRSIFPKVLKQCPDAHLTLVGLIPPSIKKQCASHVVTCTGSVSEINSYLQNATIGLCPVQAGSGMKVKILNYCASGIPVITTSLGHSGYEGIDGIIVEDDITKYPEIIVKTLKDKNKLGDLGRRARRSVISHFDAVKIAEKMKHVYQIAVSSRQSQVLSKKKVYPLAKPLWLREGRTPKIKNKYYYIIRHGTILNKKNTLKS